MINQQKKRVLALTVPLTLAPMLYGIAVYNQLPVQMVTHWGLNNNADGFASKPLAVFGLPILMAILQIIMVLIPAAQTTSRRFNRVNYAVAPFLSLVLYTVMIRVNLGAQIEIRQIVLLVIGIMFVALGNYMPTVSAGRRLGWNLTDYLMSRADWPQARRWYGRVMVIGGLLLLMSIFLSPMASVMVLIVVVGSQILLPIILMMRA